MGHKPPESRQSNFLNFAIAPHWLSSSEHKVHLSMNLGGNPHCIRQRHGLREIARNMGIPAGTVLARSKREGWTQQIAQAKLTERPEFAPRPGKG